MKRARISDVLCLLCAAVFAFACLQYRAAEAAEGPGIYTERQRAEYHVQLMEEETDGGKIDINSASAETLTLLPGIGEVRAEAIISYREAHGGFKSVDELLEIDGIGPAILEGLEEYITAEEMK